MGEASNRLAGKMGVEAFYPTDMDRECEKAARILRTFTRDGVPATEESDYGDASAHKKTQKVFKKIPPRALEQAKGIAIFTVFRTGLGWSGAGGSGVVVRRQEDGCKPCFVYIVLFVHFFSLVNSLWYHHSYHRFRLPCRYRRLRLCCPP